MAWHGWGLNARTFLSPLSSCNPTKLWPSEFSPPDIIPALENTLGDLRLTHLDLFLLHIPVQMAKPWHSPPKREDRVLPWQMAAVGGSSGAGISARHRGLQMVGDEAEAAAELAARARASCQPGGGASPLEAGCHAGVLQGRGLHPSRLEGSLGL
ncbi:hypothetical protein CLOP_g792 [Closterium sp. NIES-67]|nr:hypothetical protein CLOP_g792 [Closterium sp. NIES-67]